MPYYRYRVLREDGTYGVADLYSPHGWPVRLFLKCWHLPTPRRLRAQAMEWLFPISIRRDTWRPHTGHAVRFKQQGDHRLRPVKAPVDALIVSMWRIRQDGLGLFGDFPVRAQDCGFASPLTDYRELAQFASCPRVTEEISGWLERTGNFEGCNCSTAMRCGLHTALQVINCTSSTVERHPRNWLARALRAWLMPTGSELLAKAHNVSVVEDQ